MALIIAKYFGEACPKGHFIRWISDDRCVLCAEVEDALAHARATAETKYEGGWKSVKWR